MDIFTLKGLIDEFNVKAKNSIINKVYHYDTEVFFKLYGSKDKKNLYINISPANQIMILTSKKLTSIEKNPSAFCMILRKYIQGKKIKDFSLINFYRILKIEINDLFLIIKFTGKSSDIILTDKNFNVLYSLKYQNRLKIFESPEVKIFKSLKEFKVAEKLEGLPPFALKEIEYLKSNYGVEKAFDFYKKLINFEIELTPIKIGDKIYPFDLKHLKGEREILDNFNDIFDFKPDFKGELIKIIKDRIKRIEKSYKIITEEINEKREFKRYFKLGEILKINLYKIKKGMEEIELLDYENNETIKIKLDKNLTPAENMEKFFEKGKKFKRAIDKLYEREKVLKNELNYFKELLYFVEEADDINELKDIFSEITKKDKKNFSQSTAKPYKENFFKNIKIIIGKSAKGNDYLLRHFGKPDFVWCHAKNVPGAHVIILESLENLNNEILNYACELALLNSKAKNDLKGEVIYTKLKYLKKPKNAYPGQVIVTKENVLFVKIK